MWPRLRTLHRLHRLAGLALTFPCLVWMGTGILFHVKHRYAEAYEALMVPAPPPARWEQARLSPAELVARGLVDQDGPLVLIRTPGARIAYLGVKNGEPIQISAEDGAVLVPVDARTSRIWAEQAVAASPNASRYGRPEGEPASGEHVSSQFARPLPAHVFHFSGGKQVTVNRVTGEIAQSGDLNAFIDFTYRLHYLQWTPWRPVNLTLLALAVPLMVWLSVSGLRMAFRNAGSRQRTSSAAATRGAPDPGSL